MVVGIIVGISCNLLSLAGNTSIFITKGVLVGMTVEIDSSFLVLHCDEITVVDRYRLLCHDVVAEGLLEFRSHKVITWTRSVQDGEMDLEPEQVQEERNDDESNGACGKVFSKVWETQLSLSALDIQKIPEIKCDWHTNAEECENSDVFCGNDAAQAHSGQE